MPAGIPSRVTWDLRVHEEIKVTRENEAMKVQKAQRENSGLMDHQDLRGTRESRDRTVFRGCPGILVAMVSREPKGSPGGLDRQAQALERLRGPLVRDVGRREIKATKANRERQR